MGIKGDMLFCLAMQQTSVVFKSTLELEYCTELGRMHAIRNVPRQNQHSQPLIVSHMP